MRKAMKEGGVDSPNFMLVTDKMSIEDINAATTNFTYPLICKPVDLSSSRGVFKIESPRNLKEALDYALDWSKKKQVILEEFIDGSEYSGESIAYNGKYKLLAVTEKHTTGAPHFVETGHHQPASLTHDIYAKVERTLYKAFAAMRIEYGAIHPEFRITKDGKIYFMEIATRWGATVSGQIWYPFRVVTTSWAWSSTFAKARHLTLPRFASQRLPRFTISSHKPTLMNTST